MRVLIVAAAVLAAACSVDVDKGGDGAPAHGGYSVDIRANGEHDVVYVVHGPDGRTAAARGGANQSALLDAHQLQEALAAMPPLPPETSGQDHVSISAPGFSLHASGDSNGVHTDTTGSGAKPVADTDGTEGHGNVSMNFGGFSMNVNADGGGPGNADDRANVRLAGLSAHDARKIITDADDLSPAVQAQMLTALGLSQDE